MGFPEWPGLAASGRTIQEAILNAQEILSEAVDSRIAGKLDILAPSDNGPGQISIKIHADTAARLDGYLNERQRNEMRVRSEIEQIHRDRRSGFLADYHAATAHPNQLAERADMAAIKYAGMGIQFAYVLNAGGLVAIPAILQIIGTKPETVSDVVWPATIFVIGIVCAVATNLLAYLSVSKAGFAWSNNASARAIEVNMSHYPKEDETERQADKAQSNLDYEKSQKQAEKLEFAAVITCITAALAFIAGVALTIYNLSC